MLKISTISLKKNIEDFYSFGATSCRAGGRFFLVFIASILLSKHEFGLFNIFISLYFFARLFSENSLNLPFIKFASDGEFKPPLVNYHIIILKIAYVAIVSCVILLFSSLIIDYSGLERISFIYLLPLVLLGLTAYMFVGQVLNSQLKMKQFFIYEIVSCATLILIVGAGALVYETVSPENLIFLFGLSMIAAALIGGRIYWSSIDIRRKYKKELLWRLVNYSKYTVMSGISAAVIIRADVLMLGYFKDASVVAVYGIAIFVNEAVQMVIDSVQRICLPKASALSQESNPEKISDLYKESVKKIYVGMLPIVLVIGLLFPFTVDFVYQGKYNESIILIYIFLFSSIVKPVGHVAGIILGATGNIKIDNRNCWIAAVCNLLCNFALIPPFGFVGAALASCVSFIVLTFLHYFAFKRLLKKY